MDHSWIFVLEGLQEFIDDSLKGGRCVTLSEVHDFGLPMSFRGAESGLPFISCANVDIVISRLDIELGEQHVSLEFFGDVFDVGNWVLVSNRPVIDRSIVLYWVIGPILLFDAKGACGIWGLRWFNISLCELFFCPLVHEFGFRGTERIYFALKGIGSVGFKVDGMVVLPPQWWKTFRFFFRKHLPMLFIFFWEVTVP